MRACVAVRLCLGASPIRKLESMVITVEDKDVIRFDVMELGCETGAGLMEPMHRTRKP